MRKHSLLVVCIITSLCTASIRAAAQQPGVPPGAAGPAQSNFARSVRDSESQHLLTRSEGRALVEMALSQPPPADDQPDCSHFVHQIFAAAGLDYPYKTSFELYAGIPEFQQVRSAQPGDLVVWRGHVGLVVDPAEHSFYSSVDSGLQTQQYDTDYWRRRGRPRFYRYLVLSSSEIGAPQKAAQRDSRTAVAAKTVNKITDDADTDEPPTSHTAARPPNHVSNSDRSDELATDFQLPENIPIDFSSTVSNARPESVKPGTKDVTQAIAGLGNESAAILKSGDFARLSLPVVIFDQLQVEKLELKRDKGWAQVRIDYRVELNHEQLNAKQRSEKRRWELRRTEDGWVAFVPQDRVYVQAAAATRILSERLYMLSRKNSSNTRIQQASLAHLLDAVFNAGN